VQLLAVYSAMEMVPVVVAALKLIVIPQM